MTETKRESSILRRAWQRLTEPSPRITDHELRERSRLLSSLLLLLIAVSLVGAVYFDARFSPGPAQTDPELLMILGIAAGALVAYFLNRRGAYLPAALLAAGLLAAGTFGATHFTLNGALAPTLRPDDVNLLVYLALPFALAAVLLPVRLAVIAGGFIVAAVFLVPVIYPHVSYFSIVFGPMLFLLVAALFLMLIARYWQGVARRRRAALAESGERLRSLFEGSLDPVLLIAADGTITAVNAAGSELFGYPRAELEGRHVLDLYADPARRGEVVRKAERQGQLYEEPVRLKKRDGSVLDCLLTIWLRRDSTGGVLEYQTIVRDVTDRLRAEEDLKLRSELISLARDAVFLVDPAGEIVFTNEALGRLTGYGVDELVGMNVRRLNTPEGVEQIPSKISRMLREGGLEYETVYVRKDGSRADVEVRTRTIEVEGRTLFLSTGRDVTQRKADEAELRMRGELLGSVQDSVFLHDLRGNFLYVNEAAAATLGYRREELLSLKVQQMSSSEHSVLFRRRVEVLLRKGSMAFESEYLRKDGSALPVEVRATLFESGEKTLVLCVARDIAERKRAQQDLKNSEEKFRSLFEQSRDAITLVAPTGRILEVNQAWLNLHGYSRGELPGLKAADMYANPQDREDFLRRIAETGFVEDEVRFKKKDGTVMDCHMVLVARKDDEGNVVAYQGLVRDITEQKQAEKVLRESEARFRELSELLPQAICETSIDGRITFANRKALEIWGYSEESLERGVSIYQMLAPEGLERAGADFAALLRGGGAASGEYLALRKDGTVFPVEICCDLLVRSGEVVGIRAVLIDISDRKKAEQQLHDLAARVEEVREEERTGIARELHDRLAQALTALKLDLTDMKGRVEKGEAIPPGKLAGTMGLVDETEDDVRRISSELRPGMLDDLGLVAAMEWQLSQFGERSGLKCCLDSRMDESGLDRARSTALFRIFQELLTNVARHAGASGVRVSLELDDGRYILTVADDGRGMTEEERAALDSLGLIGIRERVRPFGGEIEIEGAPNDGTTVRVYVPAG